MENKEPLNHRKKWSEAEYKQLYLEVKNKMDLEEIANIHNRSIGSIKYKLYKYAIRLAKDHNLELNELSMITNLSSKELLNGFDKLNYTFYVVKKNKKSNCLYICVGIYYLILGTFAIYYLGSSWSTYLSLN